MDRCAAAMGAGLFLAGCMGSLGSAGDEEVPPMGPSGASWSLEASNEGSDVYLPLEQASAQIRGTASGDAPPVTVQVGLPGALSNVTPSAGAFSSSVSVEPGMSLVHVTATDGEGHRRDAHRPVIRADYIPEGQTRADAATLVVDDALVATLAGAAASEIGGLDLSGFITPGAPLIMESGCTIYADSLSHSPPTLDLGVTPEGNLRATARLADITVNFHGTCNALGQNITIRDSSQIDETTAELSMNLTPIEPAPGECISGFTSSDVNLELTEFDIDLRLSGCGLLCLAGELVGELAEGLLRDKLEEQIRGQLDGVIDPQLAMLSLFGEPEPIDFLGTPVEVGLCLTDLGPEMGQLTARLGSSVTGPGGNPHMAPGAPALPAQADLTTPGALYLDPALVGQIVYSVWNAGGLTFSDLSAISPDAPSFPISAIATGPEVRRHLEETGVPPTENLQVGIDAAMPPLVRAATPDEAAMGADLFIEIGDLRLVLGTSRGVLFTLSTHISMPLALEATPSGALSPVVLDDQTELTVWLADTSVPMLSNRAIDQLVMLITPLLQEQVPALLAGAEIQLPDIGGPLLVSDINPTPGGSLEVILGGGAPMMSP